MRLKINHILGFTVSALLLFTSHLSFAQKEKVQVSGKVMKNLIRDSLQVVRYIDNVKIFHQGTTMTCDSAYITKKKNIVEAYGHVVVVKEDAKLFGDFLYYDGNTSIGRVTGKEVKLTQKEAKLITDVIYFNTKLNSAYYLSSGTLTNVGDTLISKRGYYYSQNKKAYFAGLVELKNKDGRLYTDSLEYSSKDDIAYFYGPTRIYNKANYVYCEKGWYNRKTDQANFFNNAFIEKGAQKLYGQDIYYDKPAGYSRAVDKVAIVDTTRKATIYGGKANYWDSKKEAEVLENPLLVMVSGNDTLFLKANKFFVKTVIDSCLRDSTYRLIKALETVRFYKRDLQGLCDSLIYNTHDSSISLFNNPVLWNEKNQITADFMKAYTTSDNKIRKMDFDGNSFITSQEEKISFNQIKGKNMVAHFTDGQLTKLDVKGNGQAVYFLRDDGKIAAVNKAESSDLIVRFKESKISRISFKVKPISTFYPIEKVDYEEITLQGFRWLDESRPKNKFSIIPKGLDLILTDAKPGFQRDIKKKSLIFNER